MKKELLLVIIIIFCSLLSSAQTATNVDRQWQDIDSLIVINNLPKTALEKVNLLYAEAKKKGLHDEALKALLYQFSLRNKITDADINGQLSLLKKELQTTGDAASKAIINVMLANGMAKKGKKRRPCRSEKNSVKRLFSFRNFMPTAQATTVSVLPCPMR